MKTILDEFELKTIETRGLNDRVEKSVAWCYGEVHITQVTLDDEPLYQIGCTPLGLCFPHEWLGYFKTIEDACGAAKALAAANNCWAGLNGFGINEVMQLLTIGKKFNGMRAHSEGLNGENLDSSTVIPNLNGAQPQDYR